jgi:hypothetical protein
VLAAVPVFVIPGFSERGMSFSHLFHVWHLVSVLPNILLALTMLAAIAGWMGNCGVTCWMAAYVAGQLGVDRGCVCMVECPASHGAGSWCNASAS